MKNNISFKKKPGWKIRISKVSFLWYVNFQKSYSLSEPVWKDKFGTPRCEYVPYISITLFGLYIYISKGFDDYWERWLWIHKYNNGDEEKAINTWPWQDMKGNNTWYQINK